MKKTYNLWNSIINFKINVLKKLVFVLLAVFFIGIANVNAQTDATTENVVAVEEVKEECPFTKNAEGKLVCVKTGKICDDACKNKAKGTCCKGKKKTSCSKSKKSSCSKSKEGGFNFNKSNNYAGGKSSCSKKVKKCGTDCTKPCCAAPPTIEEATPAETEEAAPEDE